MSCGSEAASDAARRPRLILCPTPIGNLGDMSPRALDALRQADVVFAEDTRVTGRLLAAFGIRKRLERLDERLMGERADACIARVKEGEVVAYCSDAGMPGISDPGSRLVDRARRAGVEVEVIPGPTAVACAFAASGFAGPAFLFAGFFPRKDSERTRTLEGLASLDAALIFYESPHRVASALAFLARKWPERRCAVCRELTKLHEEVLVDALPALAAEFARREEAGTIRGEFALVIEPSQSKGSAEDAASLAETAAHRAQELISAGQSRKDVVRALQAELGLPRNEAYAIVHGA